MKLSFTCGGRVFDTEIIYSQRKTVKIRVDPPGIVRVCAPAGMSSERVIYLLQENQEWIMKQVSKAEEQQVIKYMPCIFPGGRMLLAGKERILQVHEDKQKRFPVITVTDEYITITLPPHNQKSLRDILEKWLREQARIKILERIEHYAPLVGCRPDRVFIKGQKTRWGSCSEKGNLNFNYRLIMAPPEVMDYIVVHEMCHLAHFDHSALFWDMVAGLIPAYKEHKKWLKDNGGKLMHF